MALQDSVKSLMNSNVISVLPETPIINAVDIILSNNFNGIPVTDKGGILVGIITKYDLIVNRESIRDETMVKDLMNNDPLVLTDNMLIDDAVKAFSEHHKVDPIPVVDEERRVIGIISRYDMVKLFREYGISFASGSRKNNQSSGGTNSFLLPIILIFLMVISAISYILYTFNYWG